MNQEIINCLRILSVDMIEKANSGHPGLPLGAAPMAYTVWNKFLNIDPKNPNWENRDRFVLSAGHGSALLYSLLHLHGFDLTIEDLKAFRKLDSKTPGHPEYRDTVGVEATTGPLGQGLAMGVGMAIAEAHLNEVFKKDNESIFDHYTYVLASDGDFQEGVTNEASSLAATLKLNKLIVLYDSNEISIEGDTSISFTESVRGRYDALGWKTILVENGNSIEDIAKAIEEAKKSDKPTLIEIITEIGYGSPRIGTAKAHGEALGKENIAKTREYLKWKHEPFIYSKNVENYIEEQIKNGAKKFNQWEEKKERILSSDEELKKLYNAYFKDKPDFPEIKINEDMATRASSGLVLNKISKVYPNLMGGSADLSPSNQSYMNELESFSAENRIGRNMHFGIREFAMAAISNGMALHGGLRPYCATFLVFSDYMKAAIRLAAIMKLPITYILTHDSIGVGEDGPTHQPIEQLAMLRSIPDIAVFRPADGTETTMAWKYAMEGNEPVVLSLTRQGVPEFKETSKNALKGGYIVRDAQDIDLILIASGSELGLALEAADELNKNDLNIRVVSMPSMELFERQDEVYKEKVLPNSIRSRIAIEALSSFGWDRYVGLDGKIISVDEFGASGPGGEVYEKFEINVSKIVKEAKDLLY